MNTLPPEIVAAIVDYAADCDSSYASYRARLDNLSAFSRVSRMFLDVARPRLAQVVHLEQRNPGEHRLNILANEKVQTLICRDPIAWLGFGARFKFIRDLAQSSVVCLDPDLTRLSIVRSIVYWRKLRPDPVSFFSSARFPALRALAVSRLVTGSGDHETGFNTKDPIPRSFLAQLECLVTDEPSLRGPLSDYDTAPLPPSIPYLFDVELRFESKPWSRSSTSDLGLALAQPYVRVRVASDGVPRRGEIERALFLVEDLLAGSTVLKVLYLDLYPRDGTGGFDLDKDLCERIGRIEDPARKSRVEIVWEQRDDDWIQSRVSRDYWKRCRELKRRS
ncbi:hypothetical protein JCM11491_003855 [Sporobolomyces phaffii]